MSLIVQMTKPGGVETLSVTRRDPGAPGAGEIRLRQQGAGVNFIDIYQRTGLYPLPMPAVLGVEGAGVVEAVGEGVTHVAVGDRVGYAAAVGGYAEVRLLPAWRAIKLPPALSVEVAASGLLRAFTAHMLLRRVQPVAEDTTILVHAGAGGLASVLIPWARRLGARVIATASTEAKAEIAAAHGAEQVIVGRDADIAAAARAWTDGRGVDYVVDGIGAPTFQASLEACARFGMVASVGQAAAGIGSVPVEAFGPLRSLSFSRPSVMAHAAAPATYAAAIPEVLLALQSGPNTPMGPRYPLAEAAAAQAALATGQTTGTPLLVI